MNIILGIIGYFLIGYISGIIICKIKGKEWCRNDDVFDGEWLLENNAQGVLLMTTFFWGIFVAGTILFSPLVILCRIIEYTSKKL